MRITNNQISKNIIDVLKKLKGGTLKSIYHEPFKFSATSYGCVYITVDNKTYILEDYQRKIDYFLSTEYISSINFNLYLGEINSSIKDIEFIKENLNQTISKIEMINTKEIKQYKELNDTFCFLDTKGIIFTIENDYKLILLKDDYCECISIYRGYDVKKQIDKIENELKNSNIPDYEINIIELQ